MKTNNISFTGVIGVYGKPATLNKISNALKKAQGTEYHEATSLYKNNYGQGLLTTACRHGNDVALIVAGKEDIRKVNFMEQGWTSLNGISHHIKEVVNMENYDLPSFLTQIKNLGKKESLEVLLNNLPEKIAKSLSE